MTDFASTKAALIELAGNVPRRGEGSALARTVRTEVDALIEALGMCETKTATDEDRARFVKLAGDRLRALCRMLGDANLELAETPSDARH